MASMVKCSVSGFEKEVQKILDEYLVPSGLSFFYFRRIFKDGTTIVLGNNGELLEILNSFSNEVKYAEPLTVQQSVVYFWDEFITDKLMHLTRNVHSIYHGMTIIDRYRNTFDCFSFGMPKEHPAPTSYYLKHFSEIKLFTENFPKLAKDYIDALEIKRFKLVADTQSQTPKAFFLPERSDRIELASERDQYITTYELLCIQLLREGKSYKDIGETLSMSPRTVETHLTRLKRRTGFTFDELFLKSFRMENHNDCP